MIAKSRTFPDRESAAAETFVEAVEHIITLDAAKICSDGPITYIEETGHALY